MPDIDYVYVLVKELHHSEFHIIQVFRNLYVAQQAQKDFEDKLDGTEGDPLFHVYQTVMVKDKL